jgi:hypothetical protein
VQYLVPLLRTDPTVVSGGITAGRVRIASGGYELVAFRGSQFYPFPPQLARLLAETFPGAAFSISLMIRKKLQYHDEFAMYSMLESNFWTGNLPTASHYWS